MDDNVNYPELVRQAQLGCRESMDSLAELAQGSLRAYIRRLALNPDLAEEILQETLLEMVKSLKKLKHAEAFWSWIYRTAMGKAQHYFRDRQKKAVQIAVDKEQLSRHGSPDHNDGLSSLIREELSEAIFKAMSELKFRHRNILVLRCFEQKPYSEIAPILDCSELAAQALFFRAKLSLKRRLSRRGFGRAFLLMALGLFGRITAPAEASVPAVTVIGASAKVSFFGAIVGALGTKSGIAIVTALASAVIITGGITTINDKTTDIDRGAGSNINNSLAISKDVFEYPSELVGAYDPDGNGWRGIEGNEILPDPIEPDTWLIGQPLSDRSAVILPINHWVELKFRGRIIDGPGDDIVLIEWDANGEQAGIYLTDGAGNEYPFGIALAGISGQPSRTEIGCDISGISLLFEPCAVRIIGIKAGGKTPGFDLGSVRARIRVSEESF